MAGTEEVAAERFDWAGADAMITCKIMETCS